MSFIRCEVIVYNHVDVDDLREKLNATKRVDHKLIVTDGLFSMDGPWPARSNRRDRHGERSDVDGRRSPRHGRDRKSWPRKSASTLKGRPHFRSRGHLQQGTRIAGRLCRRQPARDRNGCETVHGRMSFRPPPPGAIADAGHAALDTDPFETTAPRETAAASGGLTHSACAPRV